MKKVTGLYRRKDSSKWWGAFVFKEKRYLKSMETSNLEVANAYFKEWSSKIQLGILDPDGKKVKLKLVIDLYLNDHSKTNKKSYGNDLSISKAVFEYFGDCNLSDLTPHKIEQFKGDRLKKVTGARINRYLAFLRHVFTMAALWGYWTGENPVKKVRKLKEEKKPDRYLNYEERERLFNVSPDFLKPIILTALKTGMRQGEILSLKWEDIDLDRGVIFVRNTKAGKMRELPIHAELLEMLSKMERQEGYIFSDEAGKPLSRFGEARGAFERAVKDARIFNFTFHDLRHTFASELIMKGVDIKTVQEYLGHSTVAVTERYLHVAPDQKRTSIQLLGHEKQDFCYDSATVRDNAHIHLPLENAKSLNLQAIQTKWAGGGMADAQDLKTPRPPSKDKPKS